MVTDRQTDRQLQRIEAPSVFIVKMLPDTTHTTLNTTEAFLKTGLMWSPPSPPPKKEKNKRKG